MSPNGASTQSPTLSRDCGTTLGWRANTTATPTGLRLLSRTCGSMLIVWLRPHELERAMGHNPVGVDLFFVPYLRRKVGAVRQPWALFQNAVGVPNCPS